jgi:hypothetical protein
MKLKAKGMEGIKEWKPKKGSKYYWIGSGHILKGAHKAIWEGNLVDEGRYVNKNCFRSKKEAEWIYKSFNGAF